MQDTNTPSQNETNNGKPISIGPGNPPVSHQDAQGRDAPIACDYIDVVRSDGEQPRFVLQPHLSGGAVASPAFCLEIEGARALVQHLNKLING